MKVLEEIIRIGEKSFVGINRWFHAKKIADLKILDERYYGYKLDSDFANYLLGDLISVKLPTSFVVKINDLEEVINRDPIDLRNSRLRGANDDFVFALRKLCDSCTEHLHEEGKWNIYPVETKGTHGAEFERVRNELVENIANLKDAYGRLFNAIYKSGGKIRETIYVA